MLGNSSPPPFFFPLTGQYVTLAFESFWDMCKGFSQQSSFMYHVKYWCFVAESVKISLCNRKQIIIITTKITSTSSHENKTQHVWSFTSSNLKHFAALMEIFLHTTLCNTITIRAAVVSNKLVWMQHKQVRQCPRNIFQKYAKKIFSKISWIKLILFQQ